MLSAWPGRENLCRLNVTIFWIKLGNLTAPQIVKLSRVGKLAPVEDSTMRDIEAEKMRKTALLTGLALSLGLLAGVQTATATELSFTLKTNGGSLIDAFDLDSTAGQTDLAGPPFLLFDITNDTSGYNGVFFADALVEGAFGIGPLNAGGTEVNQQIVESFSPAFYSGTGLVIDFLNGSYTAQSGDVLTIADASLPEPPALLILALGLGVLGLAKSAAGRRLFSAF